MKTQMNHLISLFTGVFKRQNRSTQKSFLSLLHEYVSKQMTENTLSEATRRKYDNLVLNVQMYLKAKRLLQIPAAKMRIGHMEDLKLWLHTNLESCSQTHSARHLELCRRVLQYGLTMEYIPNNPLQGLSTKRDRTKDIIHLEQNELDQLLGAKFFSDSYQIAADLYIFQSATGLSYSDLYSFEVLPEYNGFKWIHNTRNKSGVSHYVPVFPLAETILDKYKGQLPYLTNQAYNRIIKEVAAHVGIKKPLTTHTARKTFSTLQDDHGLTTATISRMMGHSSVAVTEKHYLPRGRRNRIGKEVAHIFGAA